MASRYNLAALVSVAATAKTGGRITSAATVRPRIYDFMIGAKGTPADNSITWFAQRFTVGPTDTAVTAVPLDPSDGAARAP